MPTSEQSNKKTCVVSSADGFTGMTVMQELALNKPFTESIALIKSSHGEGEAKDIQAMDASFQIKRTNYSDDEFGVLMKDADCLILIPPAEQEKVKNAAHLLECAKKCNVKNVVMLSSVGAELQSPCFKEFAELEQQTKASGLNYCIVRSGLYAQSILLYNAQLQKNELPLPIGQQGKINFVDLADVGVALVKIAQEMCEKQEHYGKTYCITGPMSMSGEELAQELSRAKGSKVEFKATEMNSAKSILQNQHMIDQYEAKYLLEFYQNVNENSLWESTNDYKTLVGHDPTHMKMFVDKYQAELSGKKKMEE